MDATPRSNWDFPPSLREDWEELGILGEGAMGRVFRCRHRRQGYLAAVKLSLAPDDPDLAARAQREATTLARIQHPHVIRVFQAGVSEEGVPYLAMELLEGRDLASALPLEHPFGLLSQVASALDAVHAHRILHRDVKPGNIFLTSEGRAVLVDFGLVHDPERTRLTATGQIAGTPAYLAPEVFRGEPPSPAADWYALGASFFEVLEGGLPLTRDYFASLLAGGPAWSPRFTKVSPQSLPAQALRGLLWEDPSARIQSSRELEATLEGAPEGWSPPPTTASSPRPLSGSRLPSPGALASPVEGSRRRWAMILVAGLLAAVGFFWPAAPAPPGVKSALPEVARDYFSVQTRERSEALGRTCQALRELHPDPDRLFSVSWASEEVPEYMENHSVELLKGEDDRLATLSESLVLELGAWLTQLRDLEREEAPQGSPFEEPEIHQRLFQEVAPALRWLSEDHLLWSVRDSSEIAVTLLQGAAPRGAGRRERLLDSLKAIRLQLEDSTPIPVQLLPLWMVLPREPQAPGLGLETFLPQLLPRIDQVQEREELWQLLSASFYVLSLEPWLKRSTPSERRYLVTRILGRLEAPDCPLTARERDLLAGRGVAELARIARIQEPLDDPEPFLQLFEQTLDRVLEGREDDPVGEYSVLWTIREVIHARSPIYYSSRVPPTVLADLFQRRVLPPYRRLQALLRSQGRVMPERDDPTGGPRREEGRPTRD